MSFLSFLSFFSLLGGWIVDSDDNYFLFLSLHCHFCISQFIDRTAHFISVISCHFLVILYLDHTAHVENKWQEWQQWQLFRKVFWKINFYLVNNSRKVSEKVVIVVISVIFFTVGRLDRRIGWQLFFISVTLLSFLYISFHRSYGPKRMSCFYFIM